MQLCTYSHFLAVVVASVLEHSFDLGSKYLINFHIIPNCKSKSRIYSLRVVYHVVKGTLWPKNSLRTTSTLFVHSLSFASCFSIDSIRCLIVVRESALFVLWSVRAIDFFHSCHDRFTRRVSFKQHFAIQACSKSGGFHC